VHIVDARTFDSQQTLRVGSAVSDTPITGLCFSNDSKKMFVGKFFFFVIQSFVTFYYQIGLENAILDFTIDTGTRRRFAQGSLL
jgi:hypothetical protein